MVLDVETGLEFSLCDFPYDSNKLSGPDFKKIATTMLFFQAKGTASDFHATANRLVI